LTHKKSNVKPERYVKVAATSEFQLLIKHRDLLVIQNDIMYKKLFRDGADYLTFRAPEQVRFGILSMLHSHRTAGHFGRERTVDAIRQRFYWPNINESVQRWCELCDTCAQIKPGPWLGKSPFQHIKVNKRFQVCAIDIMGPLPCTDNGNEYILFVTDYFSKFVKSFALPNHTALTVAVKIVTEVICRYGAMEQIHSDISREFMSQLFTETSSC